jgi:choline dehydrogenase-like flavoprotein
MLVQRGVPVTMLESGTATPAGWLVRAHGRNVFRRVPQARSDPGDFVSTGDPGTVWYQHLEPGGLSNQWTGAVPRFDPADFDDGRRLHARYVWPLTYEGLSPYYDATERLLDVTGSPCTVPALPAGRVRHERWLPHDWQEIGHVAAAHGQGLTATPLADGPNWLFVRRATAFNSATNIVAKLSRDALFEVRTGAHALRLEWSGARRAISGVVYADRVNGGQHRLPARAVVVACGPLRSTKLLFDSACSDFPDGLGNNEGLLGKYLHDHPKEWWSFRSERPLSRLAPSGYLTRRPYPSSEPLLATSWTIGNASGHDKWLSLTPLRTHSFGVQVFGSIVPTEHNYVRPSSTRLDEYGLPQLEVHIAFDCGARSNVANAREHLLGLLEEAGYRSTMLPVEPQLVPGMAVHYGGTARMHTDRSHGVLDEWNRPFDVQNLVVADASCFTTNSEKNPTLTAMALAARAADRLADDVRSG